MKIYLIRHGKTTGDVEDRYGGDYDDHLTDEGKEQSKKLAEKLVGSGIEVIFCSPRIRAQETARIVAEKIGCKIDVVHDIRERNMYGILTGMVKTNAKERYPEHVEALKQRRHSVPESEDYERFGERVRKALDKITSLPYKTIGVLSHGGPISFIFREVIKLGDVQIENCGFAELERKGEHFSIIKMDGIALKDKV